MKLRSPRSVFTEIYERNSWGSQETASGSGSTLAASAAFREALPKLIHDLKITSLLDAGCGDFNWMSAVDLSAVDYLGVDVVPALISRNSQVYGRSGRSFAVADITKDKLPSSDLALCRDCLIHLPNRLVIAALRNLKASGVQYLLATTSPTTSVNNDIWPGSFRLINLEIEPFNLPKPIRVVEESANQSTVLGLWEL